MSRFKYTKESGNQRLKEADRTVRIIEAGKNASRSKSKFECLVCGYTWYCLAMDIFSGHGCHKCAGIARVTEEECHKRLKGRSIKLVYYAGSTAGKSHFECTKCLHTWETSFRSIDSGQGCAKCSGCLQLTVDECQKRLTNRNLEVLTYGGSVGSKSVFKCHKCDKDWTTTFEIVNGGCGCPNCAKTGFNPSKPAWLYVLLLDTPKGSCYGFGITNVLKGRMKRHKNTLGAMLDYKYPPRYFDSGVEAQKIEQVWKQSPYVAGINVEGFKTECVLVNSETTKMIFQA